MYFFVAIFALISLLQDQKIKAVLSPRHNRSWHNMQERMGHELMIETEETEEAEQTFLGEQ